MWRHSQRYYLLFTIDGYRSLHENQLADVPLKLMYSFKFKAHNFESGIDANSIRGQIGKKDWTVACQSDSSERIANLELEMASVRKSVLDLQRTNARQLTDMRTSAVLRAL